MSLVPTMAMALLNLPDLGDYDFHSMKQIFIGGAAASPELIERMEKAFRCEVLAGYGLTETCPVATAARRKVHRHLRRRGRPVPPPGNGRVAASGLRSA